MKTIIELYDERPFENVLAVDVFRPEHVVFLCERKIAQSKTVQSNIRNYFANRGMNIDVEFMECSLYHTSKVKKQLISIYNKYPECALDITGGTDAALFAGGLCCAETGIPVFTFSRKKSTFFNINNAEFAENYKPQLRYSVSDFFAMAGGEHLRGRVDNASIDHHFDIIEPFFNTYIKHRGSWNNIIAYFQHCSESDKYSASLSVSAPYHVSGDRGRRIPADKAALEDFEAIGLIKNLRISGEESVSFGFADSQIKAWLRDVGSVLELYIYKACCDAGVFSDVCCSAVVKWEQGAGQDAVTNEIDVVAVNGLVPVFISCKTCPVDTDALNELAILRDRFGGSGSVAAIVTTEPCRAITRRRASELNIDVIDYNDISSGDISAQMKALIG